jgi:hypothetical protein
MLRLHWTSIPPDCTEAHPTIAAGSAILPNFISSNFKLRTVNPWLQLKQPRRHCRLLIRRIYACMICWWGHAFITSSESGSFNGVPDPIAMLTALKPVTFPLKDSLAPREYKLSSDETLLLEVQFIPNPCLPVCRRLLNPIPFGPCIIRGKRSTQASARSMSKVLTSFIHRMAAAATYRRNDHAYD